MFGTDQYTTARSPEWFVLRVPGRETITWEKELNEGWGLESWTPWMWIQKRKPRSKETYWDQVSIFGSYLFLRVGDIDKYKLLPASILVEVTPMTIGGRFVLLEDKELDGLREHDRRDLEAAKIQVALAKRAKRRRGRLFVQEANHDLEPDLPTWSWAKGDKVRVKGVLSGVEGVVESVMGDEVEVAIKIPAARLKVPGFLLEPL